MSYNGSQSLSSTDSDEGRSGQKPNSHQVIDETKDRVGFDDRSQFPDSTSGAPLLPKSSSNERPFDMSLVPQNFNSHEEAGGRNHRDDRNIGTAQDHSRSFYHELMASAARQGSLNSGGMETPRRINPISIEAFSERQQQLSRAKLKATSRTSALLAGFAMVALVELDLHKDMNKNMLLIFAIVTTLLVSVHLLALMMSTCILPHLETSTTDLLENPKIQLKWYIELSWFFSTCLGLLLFLIEIAIVFWIKFIHIKVQLPAYVTTGILVPVFVIFLLFTYTFYKKLRTQRIQELDGKLHEMGDYYTQLGLIDPATPKNCVTPSNVRRDPNHVITQI